MVFYVLFCEISDQSKITFQPTHQIIWRYSNFLEGRGLEQLKILNLLLTADEFFIEEVKIVCFPK